MKILCETTTVNRLNQTNVKSRSIKTTLALVSHKKLGENEKSEIFIILFTTQNKTGQKYKVRDNINKIFTKFANEGKITISFKQPEHDIFMKSDTVQINLFLKTFKLAVDNKTDCKSLGLSNIGVTSVPSNLHPQKKLVIKSRGEYPLKGFPRTLTTLAINGIDRQRFDGQILFLKNLQYLDLSNNSIKTIPKNIGDMNICDINLSNNNLGDYNNGCDWKWLDGQGLRKSLNNLDLSGNNIQKVPSNLINLKSLICLKLNNNKIERIPFAVGRLTKLRFLHVSNNQLSTLPSTLRTSLFDTIDVSGNQFSNLKILSTYSQTNYQNTNKSNEIHLWKLAAQVVTQKKIKYSLETLPKFLLDIIDRTPQCDCGIYCFTSLILEKSMSLNFYNCKNLIKDYDQEIIGDSIVCFKCSKQCKRIANSNN